MYSLETGEFELEIIDYISSIRNGDVGLFVEDFVKYLYSKYDKDTTDRIVNIIINELRSNMKESYDSDNKEYIRVYPINTIRDTISCLLLLYASFYNKETGWIRFPYIREMNSVGEYIIEFISDMCKLNPLFQYDKITDYSLYLFSGDNKFLYLDTWFIYDNTKEKHYFSAGIGNSLYFRLDEYKRPIKFGFVINGSPEIYNTNIN